MTAEQVHELMTSKERNMSIEEVIVSLDDVRSHFTFDRELHKNDENKEYFMLSSGVVHGVKLALNLLKNRLTSEKHLTADILSVRQNELTAMAARHISEEHYEALNAREYNDVLCKIQTQAMLGKTRLILSRVQYDLENYKERLRALGYKIDNLADYWEISW